MPIQVVCPGCHARFKVSDKFAGKKGPCPKCKAVIQVPTADDQVVIHEPEHSEAGARSATGAHALKPIERLETEPPQLAVAAGIGISLLVLLIAVVFRFSETGPPRLVLPLGAVVLGPLLAWFGYGFLRNEEDLAPFEGVSRWVRAIICGGVYAGLWLLFSYLYTTFFGAAPVAVQNVVFLAPVIALIGAATAYFSFDLDLGNSFFHFALYMFVTMILRLVMGLPAV